MPFARQRLDVVGHAELRQRPADANHGHRSRRIAIAIQKRADWDGLLQLMRAKKKSLVPPRRARSTHLHPLSDPRRLHGIIADVLRLARNAGVEAAEVHVDEVLDDLTRFANNAIHQMSRSTVSQFPCARWSMAAPRASIPIVSTKILSASD